MMDAGWYLLGCDRPPAGTKLPVRWSWSHTPWTSQFAKQVESENGIEPNNSEMKTNSPSWNNKTVKATMIDIIKHRLLSALSKTQQSLRPQKHLNRFSARPRSRRSPAVFCSRWIAKTKQKIETLLMAHFSFADEGSTMKHYVASVYVLFHNRFLSTMWWLSFYCLPSLVLWSSQKFVSRQMISTIFRAIVWFLDDFKTNKAPFLAFRALK